MHISAPQPQTHSESKYLREEFADLHKVVCHHMQETALSKLNHLNKTVFLMHPKRCLITTDGQRS